MSKALDNDERCIRHAFSTPEGKVALATLKQLFYDRHVGLVSNAEAQFFLGQRNVLELIINIVESNDE